jgi:RNA polymerase sigma-70 factor (ECF subfamily)
MGDPIIERARRGDRDAQDALWRANRRWVAAIILAHRPRSVDVEDLMQDVAVKFISKLQTLRDASSFKPWLRQIAINSCRGAARRDRPSLRLAAGEQPESGEIATPALERDVGRSGIEHRDAAARLYAQLLTLPSEYAEPLIMRCVQDLSYQQISEILGLPITTVETRLARARRMLRQELDGRVLEGDAG